MKTKLFKSGIVLVALMLAFVMNTYATKHRYYMDNVMATTQNVCAIIPLDTFIVYTPTIYPANGWTSNWLVDSSNVTIFSTSGCDSIVFVPTSITSFDVRVVASSGFNQMFILHLFSAPPSHADFSAFSGGSINVTNDTIWMCGNSVSVVATGITGDDASYMKWTKYGSFFSSDNPIPITEPGTYVFERGNPCDTTRDTIVVIQLPTSVPVWTDTTFCNTSVSLLLDPGPGYTYSWTPGGATTQTLAVTSAGIYSVVLDNACIVPTTISMEVKHFAYPTPDLTYQMTYMLMCDSTIVLNPAPGYTYDSYHWNTGATTPTLAISAANGHSMAYRVTVTSGACTAISSQANFDYYYPPKTPEICVVTVDETLNKNLVVWNRDIEVMPGDPDYATVNSYTIYKATGAATWDSIGTVLATDQHTFVDQTSTPPMVSSLYKISAQDRCGLFGQKSYYHKTILLSVNQGLNPGQVPLLWSPYTDESATFVVDKYFIYKGPSISELVLYDSTPGFNTSYVDTGVYIQQFYQIVVTKVGGCDPSPMVKKGGPKNVIDGSYSNVTKNIVNGIDDVQKIRISIYPNPSSDGIFHIDGDQISLIEVYDNVGRRITQTNYQPIINLGQYGKGVYTLRFFTSTGSTNKMVIVQ